MRWTLRDAFASFNGAQADNHVWGWSAVGADGRTVVITVWRDQVLPDGSVDFFGHPKLDRWRRALGNRSRIKHLTIARDLAAGRFRVVWVTAKDVAAIPRSIARLEPDPSLVMRLIEVDEDSGEFKAEPIIA